MRHYRKGHFFTKRSCAIDKVLALGITLLLGKEPVLRGKTTNDDDKRVARRIMSYV